MLIRVNKDFFDMERGKELMKKGTKYEVSNERGKYLIGFRDDDGDIIAEEVKQENKVEETIERVEVEVVEEKPKRNSKKYNK